MATGVVSWSKTAANNATADSTVNFAEGQAPSTVNDSCRSAMASTAKYRDDIAGAIVTGGTSSAYTVTSNQGFGTLAALHQQVIAFAPHITNATPATLNVDSLGAKPLRSTSGVELTAGALLQGTSYTAIYNNSDAAFYLRNFVNIVPAVTTLLRSYISGLTLSTAGSSATFTVAAGSAADSTNVDILTLSSSLSKTTSAWSVGAANGALDTGGIAASTWYHVFLIKRTDTAVIDVLISLSASSPSMPANYTEKRRIGAMLTNGSSQWTLFHQLGDNFLWDVRVTDQSGITTATTATLQALTVPTNVQVDALFNVRLDAGGTSLVSVMTSPDESDQAVSTTVGSIVANASESSMQDFVRRTNTSAQIRHRENSVTATWRCSTYGWIDRRGRDS